MNIYIEVNSFYFRGYKFLSSLAVGKPLKVDTVDM